MLQKRVRMWSLEGTILWTWAWQDKMTSPGGPPYSDSLEGYFPLGNSQLSLSSILQVCRCSGPKRVGSVQMDFSPDIISPITLSLNNFFDDILYGRIKNKLYIWKTFRID